MKNKGEGCSAHKEKWAGFIFLILAAMLFLFGTGFLREQETHIYNVFCVGDSITYGSGVSENRELYSYPAQLQQLLGESYAVYNCGASGRTLQSQTDWPYRDTGYIETIHSTQADIIVLMLGSNDSKRKNWNAKEFAEQYKDLVKEFQKNPGKPKIYIAAPPRAFPREDGVTAYGIDNRVIRDEINQIVREVAEETGAEVIDIYEATSEHPEYFMDGVHPNKDGNAVLARVVYQAITGRF